MIRCIIIDDEQHAIDVIRSFCKKIPYLEVIGEFTDPVEAASFVDVHRDSVDLVFLDIEMPRFSGIDFLNAYSFPNVIMVTAYTDFALDSYRYGVVDYLLKPFSFDRFSLAISKVYGGCQEKKAISESLQKEESCALYLKTERNKYVKLAYSEIKYIKGAKNLVIIYTTTSELVVSKRLNELEQLLPEDRFFRVHKSHIINIDYLESINGNAIKLKATDGSLQLGDFYRQDFMNYINRQTKSAEGRL